jgi:hypothetical protein
LENVQFTYSKVRNLAICDKFQNFSKFIKNSEGPKISNRGSFSFSKTGPVAVSEIG